MKNLLALLFTFPIFLLAPELAAQENDNWDIQLGKRKNNIFSRKIQEINLGNSITSFNPLFFKVEPNGEWQRVGLTGKKILPYIPSTEFSARHFKKYKVKKIKSYWSLGASIACALGWGISSIDYIGNRRYGLGKALFQPRSMAFLVGNITFNILGSHWNTRGDLNLFMAVNGEQLEEPKPAVSWYLNGRSDGQVALGFSF